MSPFIFPQSVAIYAQASDRRDQGAQEAADGITSDGGYYLAAAGGVADGYAAGDGGYFSAGLVGVWEDHGVGVDLEFDSSEDYA